MKLKKRTIEHDIFGTKPKRKGINSKRKGNTNELAICKPLALWTGSEFTRVPQSGGLRWKSTMNICGDVISTNNDFDFPFEIETKHLNVLRLEMLSRDKNKIKTHWQQALFDGYRSKKVPMMFLRSNGMVKDTWYLFVDAEIGLIIHKLGCESVFGSESVGIGNGLMVFYSNVFFNTIKYADFLRLVKKSYFYKRVQDNV